MKNITESRLRLGIVLLLAVLLLSLHGGFAFADDSAEGPEIAIPAGDGQTTDVRLGDVQASLEALGYYSGEHTMVFDADTQYALYDFSQENGLTFTYDGVTEEQWKLLQAGTGKPARVDYSLIAYGAYGDDVLKLQLRLQALGYYTGEIILKPATFDDGTQAAVELFCATNNIDYEGSGIDVDIQKFLYSDGARPYEAPKIKLSASQKLTAYMTSESDLFGMKVPKYFMWICGALIAILTVVLFIFFFIPGRDKKDNQTQSSTQEMPKYWRKSISNSNGVGLVAMEKLAATGNLLDFQVQYDGDVKNVQCVCKPSVTIGRSNSAIRLDPRDTSVSNSHFDLYYRGAVLMLRDHSSNGTYVNGRLIHKSECRIHPGDKIRIGGHVLIVQF